MDQDKKATSAVLLLLLAISFIVICVQYLDANRIDIGFSLVNSPIVILRNGLLFRLIYVLLIILTVFLLPGRSRAVGKNVNYAFVAASISGIFFVAGFSHYSLYNLIFFPIVMLSYTIFAVIAVSSLRKGKLKSDDSIFGCSSLMSDFYFEFPSSEGLLRVHKPQQNIWIDGGPGSGKSETFIKAIIYQCAQRNYAGVIYDWEGDPTKPGSPTLSNIAYSCIRKMQSLGTCRLKFAFINFTDMMKTERVNVLSTRYITPGSESLFIRNIASILMKNLEPAWKEKTDFWAGNAINFVYSVAYKCYKERSKGINTLPHVIAFCLNDSDSVFRWLEEDREISLNMSSMLTAWKLGAQQQTAGAVSSAQLPLVLLNNKYIFWVLSPQEEDELSLDITHKDHPTLLCIGNAPTIKEAVSPPISCIMSVVMSQMNNSGKERSVFLVDEIPTINLQGIDTFIGTARKHHVSTILALQDFNQMIRDYGERSANILKASCGSQFFGMTGNNNTAEALEKLFGESKEIQESFSEQDSGGSSRSESLQREKIVKAREVAGQKVGHFIGKVANGEPPFFNTQFAQAVYEDGEKIPDFSKAIHTGDISVDREIMEELVNKNYERIIDQVNQILSNYN